MGLSLVEMAIGVYPIPPPDEKTIAEIFGKIPSALAEAASTAGVSATSSTPVTQSPAHSESKFINGPNFH